MESISNINIKNKIILLREDLNSDVISGKVLMSERIKQSAKAIQFLKNKKAKVVVIAHQGRPGEKDFLPSLEQHAKLLNKFVKIKFIPEIISDGVEKAIRDLKPGEALLLNNIRSLNDEFSPGKNKFVIKLSQWCDIYVNDAFSVSHRVQTSVVSFPKYMKSYAGPLLEKEVNALEKIRLRNCLYILAGAKPEDNIKLLKNK